MTTLEIHGLPVEAASTIPTASPLLLEFETSIRMRNISYTRNPSTSTSDYPRVVLKKETNNDDLFNFDSNITLDGPSSIKMIRDQLNRLGNELTPIQEAISTGIIRIVEELTCLMMMLLEHPSENLAITRVYSFARVPVLTRFVSSASLQVHLVHALHHLRTSTQAHSDLTKICNEDILALSNFLQNNKFIFGNEPCDLDAMLFSILSLLLTLPNTSPLIGILYDERCNNLHEYVKNIKDLYWPDWNDLIPKKENNDNDINYNNNKNELKKNISDDNFDNIPKRLPSRRLSHTPSFSRMVDDPLVPPTPHYRPEVVITGISAGIPGDADKPLFGSKSIQHLIEGKNCITPVPQEHIDEMLDRNIVQLVRDKDGKRVKKPVDTEEKCIHLSARTGKVDLRDYGVAAGMAETMDKAAQMAVAAGLEALKDAGIVKGGSTVQDWELPEELRNGTGVLYASSFPALDAAIGEVMRFLKSTTVDNTITQRLINVLRHRFIYTLQNGIDLNNNNENKNENELEEEKNNNNKKKKKRLRGSANDHPLLPEEEALLSDEVKNAFNQLLLSIDELKTQGHNIDDGIKGEPYIFDRKFLFKILVLGNAQLAQIIKARGPNTQTNAACSGTTQAIGMAQDMIQQGRCERIIVVAGDNASGDALMPWLGSGFRALGAASIKYNKEEAALPFDARRNGLLLGAGAIGMVLETKEAALKRWVKVQGVPRIISLDSNEESDSKLKRSLSTNSVPYKARLIATQYTNSAYHGAALERNHIASELERFLQTIARDHGITREMISQKGVYFSHETCTHATPKASCASNEVHALHQCFDRFNIKHPLICNSKGFTGHPMAVSFEDVLAVEVLQRGIVPPIPNWSEQDEHLGALNLSLPNKELDFKPEYALRFSAGFGSQVALALYAA